MTSADPYGIEHVDDYGLDWDIWVGLCYKAQKGLPKYIGLLMGMWGQVDPYAESFYSMSPFCSMGNSPVMYTDPEGGFIFTSAMIMGLKLASASLLPTLTITATAVGASGAIMAAGAITSSIAAVAVTSSIAAPAAGASSNAPPGWGFVEQSVNYNNWDVKQYVNEPPINEGGGTMYQTHYGYQRGENFLISSTTLKPYNPVAGISLVGGPDQVAMEGLKYLATGAVVGTAAKGLALWRAARAAKGVTKLLKPLGLGSTGRTAAANLTEQLAMKEIMTNPSTGKTLIKTMKDASGRWNGWSKMSNRTAHGVEIHYNGKWVDGVLKAVDDFKFIGN